MQLFLAVRVLAVRGRPIVARRQAGVALLGPEKKWCRPAVRGAICTRSPGEVATTSYEHVGITESSRFLLRKSDRHYFNVSVPVSPLGLQSGCHFREYYLLEGSSGLYVAILAGDGYELRPPPGSVHRDLETLSLTMFAFGIRSEGIFRGFLR